MYICGYQLSHVVCKYRIAGNFRRWLQNENSQLQFEYVQMLISCHLVNLFFVSSAKGAISSPVAVTAQPPLNSKTVLHRTELEWLAQCLQTGLCVCSCVKAESQESNTSVFGIVWSCDGAGCLRNCTYLRHVG